MKFICYDCPPHTCIIDTCGDDSADKPTECPWDQDNPNWIEYHDQENNQRKTK